MDFDKIIERRGTHSAKWDLLEPGFGISPDEGIPMWVADMDFAAAPPIQDALKRMMETGVYGYYGADETYRAAICWWMDNRHGWTIDPGAIFTTHGLVNGVAMSLEAFTKPGDGIILMTPVYHAFSRVIRAAGREVVECPLTIEGGVYQMDFDAWDAQMTGAEKMIVLCSPHNPGGRVWTRAELEALAAFAKKHDLLILSDEIHHDLVFSGSKHVPMALIEGTEDRLIMMSATTKTFNIAGAHVGNVIIHDAKLREAFAAKMAGMGLSPNAFGMHMAEAAYSPAGALWVDELVTYLDGNHELLTQGLNAIPGVEVMPMASTYLAWVDFEKTGMSLEEAIARVEGTAKVAVNKGPDFGTGGESFLRFNFATQRALVVEAVERVQEAFRDLQ